jgi:hypothetical protein
MRELCLVMRAKRTPADHPRLRISDKKKGVAEKLGLRLGECL